MINRPQHIDSLFQQNNKLLGLLEHTQLIKKFNSALAKTLPAPFASDCYLANIRDNTLIIHTDNAALANLLHFQTTTLCRTLSNKFALTISNIEVKVRPQPSMPPPANQANRSLPASASLVLQQTAQTLDNQPLTAALNRLATRVKP